MKKYLAVIFAMLISVSPESCFSKNSSEKTKDKPVKGAYLDYAAAAPISLKAKETMDQVSMMRGNSSGISEFSKKMRDIEERSARIIADKINADSIDQIVFVNNATVANNIAILGFARKNPDACFITSKIEHKSILKVFEYLKTQNANVNFLDVNQFGFVDLKQLEKILRENVRKKIFVSIQTLNSEIGTIQPIEKIGKLVKKYGGVLHSDASQSFGKYDINVKDAEIDFLTMSGYKIGAPKGIAALYVRDRKLIAPILFGTGDELFPGTKPTALIAAFAAAVSSYHFDRREVYKKCDALMREFRRFDGIHVNSPYDSHIVSISIDGVLLKDLLKRLRGYAFSSGCSCSGMDQSNVLKAIDPEEKLPSCTIRISFSDKIQDQKLKDFARRLMNVVEELRKKKDVKSSCENSSFDDQKKMVDYLKNIRTLGSKEEVKESLKKLNIEDQKKLAEYMKRMVSKK